MSIRDLLRDPKPPKNLVQVKGMDGVASEQQRAILAEAQKLRVQGRAHGVLQKQVGSEVMEAGRPWPTVMMHHKTDTLEVPSTFEGLLSILTLWDSHLLDSELQVLHNVVNAMIPAGIEEQKFRIAAIKEEYQMERHNAEHHPGWAH